MNTNKPIKLVNPLSEHPTEMWLQAIADFEAVLGTRGYQIDMGVWIDHNDYAETCEVCIAGASLVRRAEGIREGKSFPAAGTDLCRKLYSIDYMRRGLFGPALTWLRLPVEEDSRWRYAVQGADLTGLRGSIRDANETHDWPLLIKLLREAIARIDAEYARLHQNTHHRA